MKTEYMFFATAMLLATSVLAWSDNGASVGFADSLRSACRQSKRPEELARRAYFVAHSKLYGIAWSEAEAILDAEHLTPILPGYGYNDHECLVLSNALSFAESSDCSLHLQFKIVKWSPASMPTGHVWQADGSVRAHVNIPVTNALHHSAFSTNTPLGRALQGLVDQTCVDPKSILEEVHVKYGQIHHHREETAPYCYWIKLKVRVPIEPDLSTVYWRGVLVVSDDDAPRDRSGRAVPNWKGWEHTGLGDVDLFWYLNPKD